MAKTGEKPTKLEDLALVELALQRDQGAFALLLEKYRSSLMTHILKYVTVVEDAEDICQRSFEKAFMNNFEHQLEEAERGGMTVMPVLLSDQDIHDAEGIEIPQVRFLRRYPNDFAENGDGYLITPFNNGKKRASKQLDDNPYWGSDFAESLRITKSDAASFAGRTATKNILAYVNVVMRRFYADSRIEGWDIYYHPGESLSNESEASMWVSQLFDLVRFISPTQPTFMTPLVSVGNFSPDLRYRDELIHGRHGGWGRLEYSGSCSASLTYKIWTLSDLTAFSSTMKAASSLAVGNLRRWTGFPFPLSVQSFFSLRFVLLPITALADSMPMSKYFSLGSQPHLTPFNTP